MSKLCSGPGMRSTSEVRRNRVKVSAESTTLAVLVANLPPLSLIPVVHLDLQISPRIFEKNWKNPMLLLKGLGEDDSRKKPETKNLVTLSLKYMKNSVQCRKVKHNGTHYTLCNGNASKTNANESFDNGVFFYIEAKRTPSIVSKLFSKRSEHIR